MRKIPMCVLSLLVAADINAQSIGVTFSIDTFRDTLRISPYIYGSNSSDVDVTAGITARRLGGNRMTGYNWENNASNAGSDYLHSSDDYMTWVFGIPPGLANVPAITLTAFHDTSIAHRCYTLLTLPAAGYVARDKDGPVSPGQTAPSYRWREIRNEKKAPFALTPDTTDGFVYVDEEVNFLTKKYGPASGATGVKGYSIDNEPALWPSTHPRIHRDTTLCKELISKVAGGAKAVKSVDPSAEVFGGVFYGFGEYYHMQWAPDWSAYSSYENFAAALLANLRDSSQAAGERLLDVLDMHWYPDLSVPIINENNDSVTVMNRVEAPRSLWDSTYVERGWIGQYYHPQSAAIIRKTQRIIAQQYPGTKLAITEFNYGGTTDISGAVAMADVLGIFGDTGVYFASLWGDITGYVASAYRMYRNYDGNGGTFGNLNVHSATSDDQNSAVHAALQTDGQGRLHLIAINRSLHNAINGQFTITSDTRFESAGVYAVQGGSTQIVALPALSAIQGNQFAYSLAPMSVYHFVLSSGPNGVREPSVPFTAELDQNYPNPFNPKTVVSGQWTVDSKVRLVVYDLLGREVAVLANGRYPAGKFSFTFDAKNLSSGVYFYRLTAGNFVSTRAMVLEK
ncbi:MAG: glycoside hydrolase family 44 protein [Bacteroidota bacterium]